MSQRLIYLLFDSHHSVDSRPDILRRTQCQKFHAKSTEMDQIFVVSDRLLSRKTDGLMSEVDSRASRTSRSD